MGDTEHTGHTARGNEAQGMGDRGKTTKTTDMNTSHRRQQLSQ